MVQYIDKAALVAEIERLRKKNDAYNKHSHVADVCYKEILSAIDTLEVKEVDLEKEIDNYFNTSIRKNILANDNATLFMQCRKVAKYFFELGLKAQNCNSKCEDLRDDGICNFASTKLGRTMHCENISCSRK